MPNYIGGTVPFHMYIMTQEKSYIHIHFRESVKTSLYSIILYLRIFCDKQGAEDSVCTVFVCANVCL